MNRTVYTLPLVLWCAACGGSLSPQDLTLARDLQNQNKLFLLEDAGAPSTPTPGKVLVPTALLKANYCGAGRLLINHGEAADDAGIPCPKGAGQ
jgi:hypothetical protein